jgi:hypothetical protein
MYSIYEKGIIYHSFIFTIVDNVNLTDKISQGNFEANQKESFSISSKIQIFVSFLFFLETHNPYTLKQLQYFQGNF